MKRFISMIAKLYKHLLNLYPVSFREKFKEDMFLDFTDITEDANKKGFINLLTVLFRELRDYPINLIYAHLREGHMSGVFRSGPRRAAIQSAVALSLALITMFTTVQISYVVMQGPGWLFLLKIAKSFGGSLNFGSRAQLTMAFVIYLLGALLAGIVLSICLWETRRIKRYILATILGWAAPYLLIRFAASLLKINDETFRNTVIDYSWFILAGLGFGVLFSLIMQDRRKTPWLLIAGVFGYFIAQKLSVWLILPLFPTYVYSEAFTWHDLAYIAGIYSVMGIVIGALLGAVAGWSGQKLHQHEG